MAISDEIKQEKKKMKDMPLKGKLAYIWEYYKFPIIGTVVGVIFLSMFLHDWILNNRPVYLHAAFVNSNFVADSSEATIKDDYVAQEQIDLDAYNLYIDLSMTIQGDGYDQLGLANQQKLLALYSSAEIDTVTGPEDFIVSYTDVNAYADLEALLPDDLKQELTEKGYEFYYYNYDGKPCAIGIYMDGCDYLNNQGSNGAFADTAEKGKRPVFTIAVNAPHPEHAVSFLRMMIAE